MHSVGKSSAGGGWEASVPCRQILTTRHHFTPFSKTQGQLMKTLLASKTYLNRILRQGWWRQVAPWSVYFL